VRRLVSRVPVITFNNDIPDSGRTAYVRPDHTRLGRVAGELMGRFVGREGGEILFIAGFRAMVSQRERESGFRAVLAERFPACNVVSSTESRDMADRLDQIVRETLRAGTPTFAASITRRLGHMWWPECWMRWALADAQFTSRTNSRPSAISF